VETLIARLLISSDPPAGSLITVDYQDGQLKANVK
jgi:hypothetical protein